MGEAQPSAELVERALYALETGWHSAFTPWGNDIVL